MKIGGREIRGPMEEIIIIPRGSGLNGDNNDIILIARAVLNIEDFEKLCPTPKPPTMIKRGVGLIEDIENETYQRTILDYSKLRTAWMIIESLRSIDGSDIEWDTVKKDDPNTWLNYERDLRNAGFSDFEKGRILAGVMTANGLNEERVKEARERFFHSQEANHQV